MPDFTKLLGGVGTVALSGFEIALVVIGLIVVDRLLKRYLADKPGGQFRIQLMMLALTILAAVFIIVILPIGETLRGQLLSLLGILLSATIALSSTTFIANMMAGIMLRVIKSFRPGDYVSVGEYAGRVTEADLLHTELQTEDRDLTTLPNLYLVTNPVKVVRQSGTIISAEVSLGYDVPHLRVGQLLRQAATDAGLEEPFVQVLELGDFSVNYRVAGLFSDVKHLIGARSRVRAKVLDALHAGGVEIVSPNFMNTRALTEGQRIIPQTVSTSEAEVEIIPEAVIFDKAEEAESVEAVREAHAKLTAELGELESALKAESEQSLREQLEARIARQHTAIERQAERVRVAEQTLDSP